MTDTWQTFNYSSLMAVLQATLEDSNGVYVPGNLMPSGRPVRAVGASKKDLLNREMVEQWFNAVKGTYEREIEETNSPAISDDVPDIVIRGEDTPAQQPRRGREAAIEVNEDVEEALQAYEEKLQKKFEYLAEQYGKLRDQIEHVEEQLKRTRAARKAIAGEESAGIENGGVPTVRPEVGKKVSRNSKKERPASGGGVAQSVLEL